MDEKILDLWKNQMVMNYHPSRIVHPIDLERALFSQRFLSSIANLWESETANEIDVEEKNLSNVRKMVKKYNQYIFTKESLEYIYDFLKYIHQRFPTQESMIKKFNLEKDKIKELWSDEQTNTKIESIHFQPKIVTIDPSSKLYLTTNPFELFERKDKSIPYGTTWFAINNIYEPEKTIEFHSDRGPMRVILYHFINQPKTSEDQYPFLDQNEFVSMPRIMDARKVNYIPKEEIEKYLREKGIELELRDPKLDKNILSQYGRTFRPFVVDYLKSFGLDGVLSKENQLALFEPERWIRFGAIEQADAMYLALTDLLNRYEVMKEDENFNLLNFKQIHIPEIAEHNHVDKKSLEILFKMNILKS
jgi:hypothetical protein